MGFRELQQKQRSRIRTSLGHASHKKRRTKPRTRNQLHWVLPRRVPHMEIHCGCRKGKFSYMQVVPPGSQAENTKAICLVAHRQPLPSWFQFRLVTLVHLS